MLTGVVQEGLSTSNSSDGVQMTDKSAGRERSEDVQGDASGTHVLSRLQVCRLQAAVW